MKIELKCYPCFFTQAVNAAHLATRDESLIRKILVEVSGLIPTISDNITPPEIGREVYSIVSRLTGSDDPYKDIKKRCTEQALGHYSGLKKRVAEARDGLMTAIRVAIAGNVIDFGSNVPFDLKKDIQAILVQEFAVNHYQDFREGLDRAKNILFIADNAGECVFDRILIEEMGKPVTYVVRDRPIINDAVREDALAAGIGHVAAIVSSGSDAPGNILPLCSTDFLKMYEEADFIVSKGQGNYEGLSDEVRPIFFLLKAKCSVIAEHIGVPQGSIVLMSARHGSISSKTPPPTTMRRKRTVTRSRLL
ncbi:MAG: DUF89 family protein [Candidatus Aminicenantes bacterium]|nr:DUF89 family protein [Candidatus Aminicenantes bacterium]